MISYIIFFLHIIHSCQLITVSRPNKVITYALPEKRPLKKLLGYKEDTYLNFTELTTKYGYKSEQHSVTTEDGYLLTVFRILSKCSVTNTYPVILGHGINDSSDTWIVNGPETSIGFILSNNCYDVWAVNYRGNNYSRKHLRLDPNKDPMFWDFSFEQNGYYDLPAVINYVLNNNKQAKAYYIGHSQGTADFFVMGSLRPDYNGKIHLSIHLAPIAWLKNVRIPIKDLLSKELVKEIRTAFENAGFYELFGKYQLIHTVTELLCQYVPNEICGTVLAISTGYKQGTITSENLSIIFGHFPVGVSIKNLAHFGQLIASGEFQRYDEGAKRNLIKYGSTKPADYNVSLITSPVVLITATNDLVSTIKDANILSSKLPNFIENYVVPEPYWSHNNHVWGEKAKELVFQRILDYFQSFNRR